MILIFGGLKIITQWVSIIVDWTAKSVCNWIHFPLCDSTWILSAPRHLNSCHTRYRGFTQYWVRYQVTCWVTVDPTLGYASRYSIFLVTRYRDMSDVSRYRFTFAPLSGVSRYLDVMSLISYTAYPRLRSISDTIITISGVPISKTWCPDIGVNIGYNIGCSDIGAWYSPIL